MYSRKLYTEFENAANKFTTLKFVHFKDTDIFLKHNVKNNEYWQELFDSKNGTVMIMRKEELVRRSVQAIEIYDPIKHTDMETFIADNYLIDIDIFNPFTF